MQNMFSVFSIHSSDERENKAGNILLSKMHLFETFQRQMCLWTLLQNDFRRILDEAQQSGGVADITSKSNRSDRFFKKALSRLDIFQNRVRDFYICLKHILFRHRSVIWVHRRPTSPFIFIISTSPRFLVLSPGKLSSAPKSTTPSRRGIGTPGEPTQSGRSPPVVKNDPSNEPGRVAFYVCLNSKLEWKTIF